MTGSKVFRLVGREVSAAGAGKTLKGRNGRDGR